MKPRKGKAFWVARDEASTNYLVYDMVKMKLDKQGFFRRRMDSQEIPDLEEMDRMLRSFAPEMEPGEQVRVRMVVEE